MILKRKNILFFIIVLTIIVLLNILASFIFFRIDLTADKRYSISNNTKKLMSNLDKDIQINIYLDGDLNPGFLRLKKATGELLDEFKRYSNSNFSYQYINPSAASNDEARNKKYIELFNKGMEATEIHEKDDEGKVIRKVIFPWAEIIIGKDTSLVKLLKNNPRLSGEINLNTSIENLEFEFTDAIRTKTTKTISKIAFLEGHGEYPTELVYDASVAFSKYFQVDRGQLGSDPTILKDYKAIIIAGPQTAFSESDKFIIDQYIMNGGRVMWLIDGVRLSIDSLSTRGISPAIPLNLNLDDLLFKYGVRIAPVILEDMQCVQIPMNMSAIGEEPKFEPMPWYYSPLLLTSPDHPITRNLMEVKANFASAIDNSISTPKNIQKSILLVTSNATHVELTPSRIDLNTMYEMNSKTYFNLHYIPVAIALEGNFSSVFTNRMIPQGIITNRPIKTQSEHTRMVVIADADIIRNEIQGSGNNMQPLPMGLDRYSGQEYGNRNFILNSLLYLTDDDGWLQLRSCDFTLRTLNKREVVAGKEKWKIINVVLPLGLVILFAAGYNFYRKRKFSK